MTITLQGKKLKLSNMTYVQGLGLRRELVAALGVLDERLRHLAQQAAREYGVSLAAPAGFKTEAAPQAPSAPRQRLGRPPKRRGRGPMSAEQKAALSARQKENWARRRAAAAPAPLEAPPTEPLPRLVPPGTHV